MRRRSRARVIVEALDDLDFGLLVCDAKSGRILLSNAAADGIMDGFGGSDILPPRLRAAVSARALSNRFQPAVPVVSDDKIRYFVRARRLPKRTQLLVTIAPLMLRRRDVAETLGKSYAFSDVKCEMVALLWAGCTNAEIAQRMDVSVEAISHHLGLIFASMGLRRRSEILAALDEVVACRLYPTESR